MATYAHICSAIRCILGPFRSVEWKTAAGILGRWRFNKFHLRRRTREYFSIGLYSNFIQLFSKSSVRVQSLPRDSTLIATALYVGGWAEQDWRETARLVWATYWVGSDGFVGNSGCRNTWVIILTNSVRDLVLKVPPGGASVIPCRSELLEFPKQLGLFAWLHFAYHEQNVWMQLHNVSTESLYRRK